MGTRVACVRWLPDGVGSLLCMTLLFGNLHPSPLRTMLTVWALAIATPIGTIQLSCLLLLQRFPPRERERERERGGGSLSHSHTAAEITAKIKSEWGSEAEPVKYLSGECGSGAVRYACGFCLLLCCCCFLSLSFSPPPPLLPIDDDPAFIKLESGYYATCCAAFT